MSSPSEFGGARTMANDSLVAVNRWVGKSKEWTESFFDNLENYPNIRCVVLLGSAIRQRGHRRSDFDLLVVYDGKDRPKLDAPIEVDVRQYARAELEHKIARGDEVICWALKYGVAAYDPDGLWSKILDRNGDRVPLPSLTEAEKRAHKSLHKAREMLENGDEYAAADLILASLTQFARRELIAEGVFPASRPELPEQLRAISTGSILAELLEEAMYGIKDASLLVEETARVVEAQ